MKVAFGVMLALLLAPAGLVRADAVDDLLLGVDATMLTANPPREAPARSCDMASSSLGRAPYDILETRSLYESNNRSIEADQATVVTALALNPVLREPLRLDDVVNFTDHRVEVCLFDRSTAVDRSEVVRAISLGIDRRDSDAFRALAGDEKVLIVHETMERQRVHLDRTVALAILALDETDVAIDTVLTRTYERSVLRHVERTVDLDRDETLVALALGPLGEP